MGTILFFSCKSDPIETRAALELIPASAYSVTEIRVPQLMEKADFENFQKTDIYQEMIDDAAKDSEYFAALLRDPAKSGIDLTQSMYAFTSMPDGKLTKTFTAALIPLTDSKSFAEAMANANKDATPKSINGIAYYDNNSGITAWNESFALVGMGTNNRNMMTMAESVLNKTNENNLSGNKSLMKTLSKNHDINSWTSSNPYAENSDAQMGAAMMGFDPDALKDNYIYSYVDFENGKITGTSEFDLQRKLTKDFDLFFKDEVKTDFDKYIPKEDLTFAFTAALDIKGINQVLSERPTTKQMVDYSMKAYGLTMRDIANIFPGDLAVAFYNMGDADTDTYGIFMMEIGDREGLQKILDMGLEYDMLRKVSADEYVLADDMGKSFMDGMGRTTQYDKPQLRVKKNMLMISANTSILDGFTKGRLGFGNGLDGASKSLLKNHIFGGLVNIDELKLKDLDIDIPFGQVNMTASRKKTDFNLNFKNENENSLKQILNFANEVYVNEKKKDNIDL